MNKKENGKNAISENTEEKPVVKMGEICYNVS